MDDSLPPQELSSDTPTSAVLVNDHPATHFAHNTSGAPPHPPVAPDNSSLIASLINTGPNPPSSSNAVPISAPRQGESLYGYSNHRTPVWKLVMQFLLDVIPQVYLHLLLRLPAVYFSRVSAIFEEADLTLPEIKKMALETNLQNKGLQYASQYESPTIPLRYQHLNDSWNAFVDSLLRDWNTYNIVSALILSAILTILQIASAAQDPVIRYTLILSQICALVSLLLGCLYSIRFDSSMRKTYKAAEWALEAKRTKTNIWWNIWILLAMPAIWLAWSSIFYITAIMAFVWRTDTQDTSPPTPLSPHVLLLVRILISLVLALGVTSGWLSLMMFHRYGHSMDRAWKSRIEAWYRETNNQAPYSSAYIPPPYLQPGNVDEDPSHVDHPFTGSATHLAQGAEEADGNRPPIYTSSPSPTSLHNPDPGRVTEGYDSASCRPSSTRMPEPRSRSNVSAQDIEHGFRPRAHNRSTAILDTETGATN